MTRILIIDDDQELGDLLSTFLSGQGFEVRVAATGKEGLAAAQAKPDLIICDLVMPEMSGHEVLAALRQDKRLEEIPFIFLSGRTDYNLVRKSMNLGSDDFIFKPARLGEVLEAVKARLARRQRQRQRRDAEVMLAVEMFSGIVNDLGSSEAAIQWLAEAAGTGEGTAAARGVPAAQSPAIEPADGAGRAAANDTVMVTRENRQYLVKLSEIKALLADGEYSRAFWGKDHQMMFRKPLKQWETELPAKQFLRIHRRAIINLAFLDFVDQTPAGNPQLHLKDFPEALEVSQRKVATVNRALKALARAK